MKFKEIKPGMAIRCRTENEANALVDYLLEIGYEVVSSHGIGFEEYGDKTCYRIREAYEPHGEPYAIRESIDYVVDGDSVVEFSDLVEE